MEETQTVHILQELRSGRAQEAWAEFLQAFSPLILQVIRLFEHEPDPIADCYLFVCEHLSQRNFRRLLTFQPNGPASFPTWLRAVVRNLCLDWRRREFGRHRIFESIQRLPHLEIQVFRCVFENAMTLAETILWLRSKSPDIREEQVEEAAERVRNLLTPRQLWLLQTQRAALPHEMPDHDGPESAPEEGLADPASDPESLAALNEQRASLSRALRQLPQPDQLLIRLRFEQGLTLEQAARVTGLKDAQGADRRIREILGKLRSSMT